ncbi:archaeal ribosomal protein L6P [Thaumarchaeota archaeon SCGC AB-539-E09]|nr:archaeal ribosomal protein L6P [Thaumarchaeota archaeon SCGC AB-539-E09]
MAVTVVENSVTIPEGVTLALEGCKVTVTGEKGSVTKDFTHARLNMEHLDDSVKVWTINPRKKQASLVNTIVAHVKNMIKGVTKGFTYRMKIVFVHFPMTLRIQGNNIVIQNFTGERKSRDAKIVGDAKVRVEGEDIIVDGIDLEEVAQTAANIQRAVKIRRKDRRKFLDGIYVYSKE